MGRNWKNQVGNKMGANNLGNCGLIANNSKKICMHVTNSPHFAEHCEPSCTAHLVATFMSSHVFMFMLRYLFCFGSCLISIPVLSLVVAVMSLD